MPLRSVEAATRDDAIAAAREQFGPSARVVGVRRVRSGGVLGFFATERYVAEVDPDQVPARRRARPAARPSASAEDRVAELAGLLAGGPAEPAPATYSRTSVARPATDRPASETAGTAGRGHLDAVRTSGLRRRVGATGDRGGRPVRARSPAHPALGEHHRHVRRAVGRRAAPRRGGTRSGSAVAGIGALRRGPSGPEQRRDETPAPAAAAVPGAAGGVTPAPGSVDVHGRPGGRAGTAGRAGARRARRRRVGRAVPVHRRARADGVRGPRRAAGRGGGAGRAGRRADAERPGGRSARAGGRTAARPASTGAGHQEEETETVQDDLSAGVPSETAPADVPAWEPRPVAPAPASPREEAIAEVLREALARGHSDESLTWILRRVLDGAPPEVALEVEPLPVPVPEPAPVAERPEPEVARRAEVAPEPEVVPVAEVPVALEEPARQRAGPRGGAGRRRAGRRRAGRRGRRAGPSPSSPPPPSPSPSSPSSPSRSSPSPSHRRRTSGRSPSRCGVSRPSPPRRWRPPPSRSSPTSSRPLPSCAGRARRELVAEPAAEIALVAPAAPVVVDVPAEPVAADPGWADIVLHAPVPVAPVEEPMAEVTTVGEPVSVEAVEPAALARTASDPAPLPMDSTAVLPPLSLLPPLASSSGRRSGLPPVPPPARSMATVVRFPLGPSGDRRPEAPARPASPARTREVMARLRSLGIPARLLTASFGADVETRGLYAALTRALGTGLPVAPELPLGAGEVLFVVGPGVETLRAARALAASLRLDPDRVLWATRGELASLAPKAARVTTVESAIDRRQEASTVRDADDRGGRRAAAHRRLVDHAAARGVGAGGRVGRRRRHPQARGRRAVAVRAAPGGRPRRAGHRPVGRPRRGAGPGRRARGPPRRCPGDAAPLGVAALRATGCAPRMSPLRGDVLAVAFVLALPVLALGLRGDMSLSDVAGRLPWCLAAGYGAVALLRWASRPRGRAAHPAPRVRPTVPAAAPEERPAD